MSPHTPGPWKAETVMASALNPDQPMKDLCRAILRDVEGN